MLPADYYAANPQHPHWPLIVMLVLTQLSVGAFVVGMSLERPSGRGAARPRCVRCSRCGARLRPARRWRRARFTWAGRSIAFRAVIGLRHSWLSREIVAFGLFAGCGGVHRGRRCWWTDAASAR